MRFIRRLLFILVGFVLVLFLGLALILNLFSDSIGKRVVAGVNDQLKTELRVGSFDIGLLKSFPRAAVNLKDITLYGTDEIPLLEARELSLRVGLFSLLSKAVVIESAVVSKGAATIRIDKNGRTNYDIMKPAGAGATEDGSGDGPQFDLRSAQLDDIELIYQDMQSKQEASLLVDGANFSGQFSSTVYDLESDARIIIAFVDLEDNRYLAGRNLSYTADLKIDSERENYEIRDLAVSLGELTVHAAGTAKNGPNGMDLNLQLNSDEGQLADVLSLLPEGTLALPPGMETRGNFSLQGAVQGNYSGRQQPRIDVTVSLTDGRLSAPRMDGSVRDLAFQIRYTNGDRRSAATSVIEVENLRADLDRRPFEMRFRLENTDDPRIDLSADGALPISILQAFLPQEEGSDYLKKGDGRIDISQFRLRGRVEDMLVPNGMRRVESSGALVFNGASLRVNGEQVTVDRGKLLIRDNALTVENLLFEAPGTELTFSGSAENVIPVLLADSLNSKDVQLRFQANLRAKKLDIDQLVALSGPSSSEEEEAAATGKSDSLDIAQVEQRERITDFLDGTFKAVIDEFNYGKIEGEEFNGQLTFRPRELLIQGNTIAMDGKFKIDGTFFFRKEPYLEARLTASDVDANQFFEQSSNFDQDVLVADNVSGRMDARLFIQAYFDEAGNFDFNKFRTLAALGLRDGELKDFEMLKAFSTFVKLRDLERIRFTNLENFFEIRQQRIIIPVMFIQSNALNMTMSGVHTFEQRMDYNIKVNAGQVIADRLKGYDPNLRPRPAKQRGFFNLYYTIKGDLDNYIIDSDKREVRRDFEESEREKIRIRTELERAFNTVIELVEEPLDWRDNKEVEREPGSEDYLDFDLPGGGN